MEGEACPLQEAEDDLEEKRREATTLLAALTTQLSPRSPWAGKGEFLPVICSREQHSNVKEQIRAAGQ